MHKTQSAKVVSAQDIERRAAQAERENSLFAAKGALDTLGSGSKTQAIGREAEAGQLVKALAVLAMAAGSVPVTQ
ncbi:hypothetical protein NWT39_10475 [Nitrososphaera viennensis]|nr:hypothetical protein [Nitrososphaera viennensis]UVS68321.1 hypothetical protein NWT39_10475 [Nitrososphaera viennensis]